jgi:glutamate-1-semialdehyde 2,1-aminomutase
MRESVAVALKASGLGGVEIAGIDPMWFLRFESPALEARFVRHAVENGVLFKRGAYNFAALAHDDEALTEIEAGASNAFVAMQEEDPVEEEADA